MNELIKLENINFRYSKTEFDTLTDINFTIGNGEYVSILGTSGSGKSTLLSILGLINRPTSGEFFLSGTATSLLTKKSVSLLKNREIGFVFQNFNLLSHLNVFDNVAIPLSYNADVARKYYADKVKHALSLVEMDGFKNRYPDQLSGGQQQRVAIARALVNSPSLILADEPTGNLDSKTSKQVLDVLNALHQMGKTICLITHDNNYAKYATRTVTIRDGSLTVES